MLENKQDYVIIKENLQIRGRRDLNMELNEQDLKKIKALHVMLKMPVWILERETNKVEKL